jgi:hypothetical protein
MDIVYDGRVVVRSNSFQSRAIRRFAGGSWLSILVLSTLLSAAITWCLRWLGFSGDSAAME